jgi:hypothetical protein
MLGAGGAPGTGGTTVGGGAGSSSNGAGGQVDASPAGTGGSAGDNDAPSGGGAAGSNAKISGDAARESDAARATDGSDAADSSDGAAGATWTGTWASSPQGCGGTFSQRTMREIVHTSIGGTAARVRISNTFSGGPLQITDVHVAQRTTGSSIDPATDKALTWSGKADVTIAAGTYAVSDGADFVVKPLSDSGHCRFRHAHAVPMMAGRAETDSDTIVGKSDSMHSTGRRHESSKLG